MVSRQFRIRGSTETRSTAYKEIRIENYKSIQKLKLELRHFTVLIGENGSGKSNILVKDWDKQIEVPNFEGIHRVGFSIRKRSGG